MKVAIYPKETYQQVGENEYDMVNPYVEAIGNLYYRRPNVKVRKTKTYFDRVGDYLIPILLLYYEEVGE